MPKPSHDSLLICSSRSYGQPGRLRIAGVNRRWRYESLGLSDNHKTIHRIAGEKLGALLSEGQWGSGVWMTLFKVAKELSRRLASTFLNGAEVGVYMSLIHSWRPTLRA